jgi:hypothetical protein
VIEACPRCRADGWDGRTYCLTCGLRAAGVQPESPLARTGEKVEETWLRRPESQAIGEQFEESDRWSLYAEAEPSPTLPPGAYVDSDRNPYPTLAVVVGCSILGGSGWDLRANERCSLMFCPDRLEVVAESGEADNELAEIPYKEIEKLDVDGPGHVRTGGGFIGGGFGAPGAALGILEASVLNALTTRHKIVSVLSVQGAQGELFILHEGTTPKDLRIKLSPVFTLLRAGRRDASRPAHSAATLADEIGAQIRSLASLRDEGLLTDEEFEAKKTELLGRL